MKLSLEEVELAIHECMKEMDAFEYKEIHARIKKDPLAAGYQKAFVQAGLRLNKLRQYRSMLEVQKYAKSVT
jgi:hypothetical protein